MMIIADEKNKVEDKKEEKDLDLCPRILRDIVAEICQENKLTNQDVDEIWKPFERNWVYTIENFRVCES
jgi:hypothetical protein